MNYRSMLFAAIATFGALTASAQTTTAVPTFANYGSGNSLIINQISDNGLWGVTENSSTTDGDLRSTGGSIVNMATLELKSVSHSSGYSGVSDITDDGTIVVGEFNSVPGYWSEAKNGWTALPIPNGYATGRCNAVTPDGRFAVGYVQPAGNEMQAYPVMYDLTTNKRIVLDNLPVLDMQNEDLHQNFFSAISADGRYIVGQLSMSYLLPPGLCCYVYDRETSTYKMIGFDENHKGKWKPKIDGVFFCTSPSMSCNGRWVTGSAYMVKEVPGSEWPNEYYCAFRYDVANDVFEIMDGESDGDITGFAIDNDGSVYGITPAQSPYANMMVRNGNYYYPLTQILQQVYGIDFNALTGSSVTGKPVAITGDGRTFIMFQGLDNTYVMRVPESLVDAAKRVNLLASYTVDPAAGSTMTSVGSIKLTFDRNVEVKGNPTRIELRDENGQKLRSPASSGGFTSLNNTVTVSFRTTDIPEGKTYSVFIPAGMITIKGDASVVNDDIEIFYHGRGAGAVKMVEAYPADGASVARLDLTTNPVLLTFDSQLKIADNTVTAKLYRKGENDPFCDFYIAVNDKKQMLVYPLTGQRLFKDTEYRLVIPAGVVTDLSGQGANEEIVLNYIGTYVREISSDDRYLFSDQCNTFDQFMLYEGDHRQPAPIPAGWGYTTDSTPWFYLRESEQSSDMAFGAHSMYNPAGKADDWLVIPQLFIPDENCYLSFQSQSFLKEKNDSLKVYVFESDNVYNTLNASIVEQMRTKGELVYNELQDPGAEEETFTGDWRDNTVSLAKYAGKNIYIAFVNDNDDQSAVIIDNIQVVHDMRYLVTTTSADRVVDRDEVNIHGTITIASDLNTYSTVNLRLLDGDGKEIDAINETGLSLKKNDAYSFEFAKALPLVKGEVNKYTLDVTLDEDNSKIAGEVRSLTFEPGKKVILEEYSGADCANCPQGFAAVDNINKTFPGSLIPIILRTYGGDQELAVGMSSYTTFLGVANAGAPSGRINRGNIIYPMIQNNGRMLFSGQGIPNTLTGRDEELWFDHMRVEMATPADIAIGQSSAVNAAGDAANVEVIVTPALNLSSHSINLFTVVVENGLETYQENGFFNYEDENLGEWANGGRYAKNFVYPFVIDHIARSTAGTTFNGTGGLLPAQLVAGQSYKTNISVALPSSIKNVDNCDVIVMMIDAATDRVINANICPVNGSSSGIDKTVVSAPGDIVINGDNGNIVVAAEGVVAATAYTPAGTVVATAMGNGTVALDLNGYRGVVIVKAVAAAGEKAAKVVVK